MFILPQNNILSFFHYLCPNIFYYMTFSELNLNKALINALDDLGYQQPTSIQEKVFSVVMSGKDVLGIAQTGTGKTFAYLLPTLRQWQFSKDRHPQIMIVVPTRELVVQVVREIEKLTKYMSVVTVGVYGGANINTQADIVENGLDIIVGTPGRIMDLVYRGVLRLKNIKKLIIDEVDEMLNLGFRPQLSSIFDLLTNKRQNLLFSATITDEVDALLNTFFNDPVRIEAAPVGTPLENIHQFAYEVPNFNTKVNLLDHLLADEEEMSKVMVFVSTKSFADQMYDKLSLKYGEKVGVIHSNKAQNNRFNTVKNFQSNEIRILIATDIIARGIDILEVTHVINFDVPDIAEHYIHRIGRTGRADKQGISLTFVTPKEKEFQEAIEELMKRKIEIIEFPEAVEISNVLIPDELPKVQMKTIQMKPKIEIGGAFHEKSAKNKKVNNKVRWQDKMKKKYGKPKTRGQKKK